jgi:hypothetical protein
VTPAERIRELEEAGRLFQVEVAEVAWRLGRDAPEFDKLFAAITRHNRAAKPIAGRRS